MNIASFLRHWRITENPFRAEEARHDPVFARLAAEATSHQDFEKVLGDLSRPSSSIVFGEKGSGKTAIRLRIESRVRAHNEANPGARVLLIAYDNLNPMLDRFAAARGAARGGDGKDVPKALERIRLVDHVDAILHEAVPRIVDRLLGRVAAEGADLGADPIGALRRADVHTRRDLLLLAALYDHTEDTAGRVAALRRRLRVPLDRAAVLWRALAFGGWVLPAAVLGLRLWLGPEEAVPGLWMYLFIGAMAVWALLLAKHFGLDRWLAHRLAARIRRQMPAVGRSTAALRVSLLALPAPARERGVLPLKESDDLRYRMLARLRRVLGVVGFTGVVVVVDRVDEPTLVSGEPGRMRALIWPLLNNKFLQQDGIGMKLLLPLELRHELFRESSAFFQEARLDKQNLIERLSWSGAMLYDLCNARLNACREAGAEPIALLDLFEEDVSRQDLVDGLDQMHQPRDAFKLIYQCIQEHCSNVTEDQQQWRIPRLVLETVRKQQAERVQMFYRGVRPA